MLRWLDFPVWWKRSVPSAWLKHFVHFYIYIYIYAFSTAISFREAGDSLVCVEPCIYSDSLCSHCYPAKLICCQTASSYWQPRPETHEIAPNKIKSVNILWFFAELVGTSQDWGGLLFDVYGCGSKPGAYSMVSWPSWESILFMNSLVNQGPGGWPTAVRGGSLMSFETRGRYEYVPGRTASLRPVHWGWAAR